MHYLYWIDNTYTKHKLVHGQEKMFLSLNQYSGAKDGEGKEPASTVCIIVACSVASLMFIGINSSFPWCFTIISKTRDKRVGHQKLFRTDELSVKTEALCSSMDLHLNRDLEFGTWRLEGIRCTVGNLQGFLCVVGALWPRWSILLLTSGWHRSQMTVFLLMALGENDTLAGKRK